MKGKKYLYVLFLSFSVTIAGQNMPIKNVPSPEIAGLGQYGVVPVSLFTGTPNISVPLYEVKTGNYSFPISANYHLASVKPNIQPGCLGLGWSLFADGYITRSVRGMYDEQCDKSGYAPGYYAHSAKMKGIDADRFAQETQYIRGDEGTLYYELSADEFSFSFAGYSGNFYYNEDGGWTVISEHDIKVEFNPTAGEGFLNLNDLKQRINLNNWEPAHYNNRFFNKFTLVTPDGCRYEFGGINATEYSIPYYNRNSSELIPTTWRLSKITTIDNRVIEFSYDTSGLLCDLKYVPQHKIVYNMPCTARLPQIGRSGMTGYLIFPVNIKTIKTSNETLEFNYFREPAYADQFVDNYLAWKEGEPYGRVDIFETNSTDPAYQFHLLLGNNISTSSEYELRQSIKSKLTQNILHSLNIKNNDNGFSKTIYFDYTFLNRRKLSLITERNGSYNLIPEYVRDGHGVSILIGYKIPEFISKDEPPEHRFMYNRSVTMPLDYVRPATDSWGYYIGKNVSFLDTPTFTLDSPSFHFSTAEVLTTVIYPTGGRSNFEYQQNNYSKVVNPFLTSLDNSSGSAGGLRIYSITNLDRGNNILGITKYYYSETKQDSLLSSGILKNKPIFQVVYQTKNKQELVLKSKGGFFSSVTNLNSPDVGYSCVIEEILNNKGESQGYVKHRFSNYDADIYGITHYDELAIYSTIAGDYYINPFSSRSMERGQILSKEYFDKNNLLKKRITYKYKEVNPSSFVTAYQNALFFCTDPALFSYAMAGSLTRTYTHSYLTDSITEVTYSESGSTSFKREQSLSYNKHKLLKSSSNKMSNEETCLIEYSYPSDSLSYMWMEEKHVLSPVITKTTKEGSSTTKEVYSYESLNNIPYQNRMTTIMNNGYSRTEYSVNQADKYANPIEIDEKGLLTVLIWGGEGQKIIAKIENASYSQVMKVLGRKPETFSELKISQINYQELEEIRHKLPSSHFYIYKYTPELLVESVTNPNGLTTFHKYDYAGRLREKYFFEKKNGVLEKRTLNIFDYHYYNYTHSNDGAITTKTN